MSVQSIQLPKKEECGTLEWKFYGRKRSGSIFLLVYPPSFCLKQPVNYSFEGTGHTKKEAEENTAKESLQKLIDSGIISQSGQLLIKSNANNAPIQEELNSSSPIVGPVAMESFQTSIEGKQKCLKKIIT